MTSKLTGDRHRTDLVGSTAISAHIESLADKQTGKINAHIIAQHV